MYYIGIDLGTSSVKLLLVDNEGVVRASVSKEYPIYFPRPGFSEQDPMDWYNQTMEGLKELTADIDKTRIKGISFGGQMHGLVALDEYDRVIRPAILWNDGRTAGETDYLNQVIGKRRLSELTGNIAFAGFTAPKILWLKENEPENFKKIRKIMLPKDYIAYMLSGVHSTDVSDASGTLFFNVENRRWSEEMCEICGIDESWLPRIYESYEQTGYIKKSIADELNFPWDVVIAAGAGDNAAAAIGTGTVGEGACNISLGTSGTIFISSDKYTVDKENALHSMAHADGKYHLMGCMLSAASCNKWWLEDILKTGDYEGSQKAIKNLGDNDVYFLPYLMGERSPHNDPHARGTFIGMSLNTKQEDMTQAVLEGVAMALRDSLEVARSQGIKINKTKICGGGAKSRLWKEIIANVLNIQVKVLKTEEGPGYGAAMLAMVAAGEYPDIASMVGKFIEVKEVIDPRPEIAAKYEEKYRKFKRIYPALKDVYKELSK